MALLSIFVLTLQQIKVESRHAIELFLRLINNIFQNFVFWSRFTRIVDATHGKISTEFAWNQLIRLVVLSSFKSVFQRIYF